MGIDEGKLLAGEYCPKCGSHRLSFTDDWWIDCKDCGEETNAAPLLIARIAQLNKREE